MSAEVVRYAAAMGQPSRAELDVLVVEAVVDAYNDDEQLTGKIAWAHLKEFPDYYTRLDKLESEAGAYWASRR